MGKEERWGMEDWLVSDLQRRKESEAIVHNFFLSNWRCPSHPPGKITDRLKLIIRIIHTETSPKCCITNVKLL